MTADPSQSTTPLRDDSDAPHLVASAGGVATRPGGMRNALALLSASVLVLSCFDVGAAGSASHIRPEGEKIWPTQGAFEFEDKKREAISGIACPSLPTVPRRCIVATDEGGAVRHVVIEGERLILEPQNIVLQPDKPELDAEGAARDGDHIYITGSFSSKRKDCASNEGSRHVYRFNVSHTTGRADLNGKGAPRDLEDDKGALWDWMTKNPVLRNYASQCLGKPRHGANIEGLAVKDGVLYFGFREPAEDRHTVILRVPVDRLFAGSIGSVTLNMVQVGARSGIRDMLAVEDGFLLLIGPDDDAEAGPSSIALWDGSSATTRPLATLDLAGLSPMPCKPPKKGDKREIKPEALALLGEDASSWRVLVLSDGTCDGGPMSFRVPK